MSLKNIYTVIPFAVGILLLLGSACDDNEIDSEQLAQEEVIRQIYRQSIADEPEFSKFVCAALDSLSNQQAAEAWVARFTGGAPVDVNRDFSEERQMMQIQREECEAVFGG